MSGEERRFHRWWSRRSPTAKVALASLAVVIAVGVAYLVYMVVYVIVVAIHGPSTITPQEPAPPRSEAVVLEVISLVRPGLLS